MGKVITLETKPRRISGLRSRDEALHALLPKILGVLWEAGKPDTGAREFMAW
jgi:hypothetical protein